MAVRRISAWLSPEKSPQLGRTAIRKASSSLGTRERAVLHAIRILHGAAHRTAIQEEIERARIDMSFTAMGAALEWLEDNRFIASHMSDPTIERNGRRKEIFELTAKGEEALRG